MSLPFFQADHTDISNPLDLPGELLNSPASSKDYILIAGPDLIRREAAPAQEHTHTYLECLLKGMLVWCTQNKVFQDQDIIHDLHILLHNGALVPLAYRIEEYLAAAQLKEQCLRAVLNPCSQVEAIHYWLTRFPFRGYITTSYDTCIETAYAETQQGQLAKFYQSSLPHALDACRKKQPFILKLYGDLAEPDSIKLGHRLLTGLYTESLRHQLGQLFFETPAIFIGFDDADGDLTALQNLVPNGYNLQQKHSTHATGLHNGSVTKAGDQPSSDYTAHEFSPGDRPPGPVISSQGQDVTSKDERLEEEPPPAITRQEAISVSAFAEERHKGNGAGTGPPPGYDGQNGQPPHQPPKQTAENSESAAAPTGEAQVRSFQSLVKSGDLQLPDNGVLGEFKSFLKNECGDLDINVDKNPGKTPYAGKPKMYTRVTKGPKEEEVRALIYIPGSTMTDPDEIDIIVIRGLCSVFSLREDLIICTDSDKCHPEIRRNLAEFKKQNDEQKIVVKKCKIVLESDIQYLLDPKNKMDKEAKTAWIAYILD